MLGKSSDRHHITQDSVDTPSKQALSPAKKPWLTIASVCACFGVVTLHCDGVFWRQPRSSNWMIANFIETFWYWSVPIFIMISGATLLNYRQRYSTKQYFHHRYSRVVIPLLFWSAIAMFYRLIVFKWPITGFQSVVSDIINCRFNPTYWFLIALLALYLSLPLLSAVNEKLRLRVFSLTVCIAFSTISLLPTVFQLFGIQYNLELKLPVAGGMIIYALIGYIITNTDIPKRHRYCIYLAAGLGWLIQFAGTAMLTPNNGDINGIFKGYVNFPTVLQSTGVMVAFKYAPWQRILNKTRFKLLEKLSLYAFGVYLVHFYLVELIPVLIKFNIDNLAWQILGPVLVMSLSVAVCVIIAKIPLICRTIGIKEPV